MREKRKRVSWGGDRESLSRVRNTKQHDTRDAHNIPPFGVPEEPRG